MDLSCFFRETRSHVIDIQSCITQAAGCDAECGDVCYKFVYRFQTFKVLVKNCCKANEGLAYRILFIILTVNLYSS